MMIYELSYIRFNHRIEVFVYIQSYLILYSAIHCIVVYLSSFPLGFVRLLNLRQFFYTKIDLLQIQIQVPNFLFLQL